MNRAATLRIKILDLLFPRHEGQNHGAKHSFVGIHEHGQPLFREDSRSGSYVAQVAFSLTGIISVMFLMISFGEGMPPPVLP